MQGEDIFAEKDTCYYTKTSIVLQLLLLSIQAPFSVYPEHVMW